MTTKQRWIFILITLPLCSIILAIGISQTFSGMDNLHLTIGNVGGDSGHFNIGEYRY